MTEINEDRIRMLIYLVRHGETRSNTEGLMQGWTDDPLNDNGVNLARITGRGMKGIHFDACISSPLLRAKQTAEIILRESGNASVPVSFDERIKEINLGAWEGKRFRPGEREIDANEVKMFFTDPFHFKGCPGGENIHQVCVRTQAFLKELADRNDNRTYLVTTHGFALRGMLNMLYEDKQDYWHGHVPYNCAVNIIETCGNAMRLVADDKIYYELDYAVDRYAEF
jgi:broad specificity phosphatase PhoE